MSVMASVMASAASTGTETDPVIILCAIIALIGLAGWAASKLVLVWTGIAGARVRSNIARGWAAYDVGGGRRRCWVERDDGWDEVWVGRRDWIDDDAYPEWVDE